MKDSIRILVTVLMGVAIYLTGLYLIPSISFIKQIVDNTIFNNGNVTQFTFLIVSLILIFIFSHGKLGEWGFRKAPIKPVIWAVLISVPAQMGMLILMMFMVSMSGTMPNQENPFSSMSFTETVISVWLIASTCEEILYRGLLYGFIQPLKKYGLPLGKFFISLPVVVCAVMFGLGHLCLLGRMPGVMVFNIVLATTLLGFIAGYFRETTGSLIPAIAVHMTFNMVGYGIPALLQSLMGF